VKIGLQEIDWKYIGAVLAREDDDAQSDFLKSFTKECLSWGTHYQIEMQLAGVNLKLTPEEREVLAMLSFKD